IANAIADALSVKDVPLPATPDRLNALIADPELQPPEVYTELASPAGEAGGRLAGPAIAGEGRVHVGAEPDAIWRALLDPESLKRIIPGCHSVQAISPEHFLAEVSLGVGPIRGRFLADVRLRDLEDARFAHLSGT